MVILIQLIRRMIALGYTKEGIMHYINLVRREHLAPETLFTVMDFEVPNNTGITRFNKALTKADSVIAIHFMEEV